MRAPIGLAKRPGRPLCRRSRRGLRPSMNSRPDRGPAQSRGMAAWAKGVNAIRPIAKTALGNRPADRRRGGEGDMHRGANKKMGQSRKKSGETKPKISGEKIECAQLDVNSAGFGAKPRQAADWETGAAWRADKRRYAKNEKDTGFWPPPWRRVGREGRLGDRSRVRLVRRLPGAIPVF